MKRSIAVFAAILFSFLQQLPAQEFADDVIYTKDGRVIHGRIIEIVPGKSIQMETSDAGILPIAYEEIERIRFERRHKESAPLLDLSGISFVYTNIIQTGVLTGRGMPSATVQMVNGTRLDDQSVLGLGLGWDAFPGRTMFPVYLDARHSIIGGDASPFVFIDAGYVIGKLKSQVKWDDGGFLLHAGLGVTMHLSQVMSFVMQVAYRFQRLTEVQTYSPSAPWAQVYDFLGNPVSARVSREGVMITVGLGF